MTFSTVYQDKFEVYINDSSTLYYHAYQTCNILNTLYNSKNHTLRYAGNVLAGYASTNMVVNYNCSISSTLISLSTHLSYEFGRLEKAKEQDTSFKKDYRYYFDAVIEELSNIYKVLVYPAITMIDANYIKEIEDLCDNLMLKGFEALSKTYPEHGFYINNECVN